MRLMGASTYEIEPLISTCGLHDCTRSGSGGRLAGRTQPVGASSSLCSISLLSRSHEIWSELIIGREVLGLIEAGLQVRP